MYEALDPRDSMCHQRNREVEADWKRICRACNFGISKTMSTKVKKNLYIEGVGGSERARVLKQ